MQIEILLVTQVGDGELANGVDVLDVAAGSNWRAIAGRHGALREEIGGDVGDVVAVVGRCRPASIARLEALGARLHGERKVADLDTGVVVVELAGNVVALRLQQR